MTDEDPVLILILSFTIHSADEMKVGRMIIKLKFYDFYTVLFFFINSINTVKKEWGVRY